jgi:heterotetrameric sarcosine oxidase delta subunit
MIINHPHLGPRDAAEFNILGDASLLKRPDWQADDADDAFYRYLYLRDNPAGLHRELWFHEQGDRSWLVVTRDTITHAVVDVALARDVVLSSKTSKASKSARKANVVRADKKSHEKKLAKRSITADQPR